MSNESGKISGNLLSDNLLRNGVDLAFETRLLYLNVVNGKIGINTDSPVRELHVPQSILTTNLIVDTQADFPNFSVVNDTIQNHVSRIYIQPAQISPTIETVRIGTSNINISNQLIENIVNNSDIQLLPTGTGKVHFITNTVDITGSLHATGDITWDGDIIFGNDNLDNVGFNSNINSDIIPDTDNTYDLGSSAKKWDTLYSNDVLTSFINTSTFVLNDIDLLLTPGKTIYVSVNGSDSNYGDHQHSTYRSIKYALSQATFGDQIIVFPGEYTEEFPLTIPQGVSIKGTSIRSVSISPTVSTNTNDAFLLNGDTTVEFLTVKNFYQGYAFKLAPNFKSISRSPYVYNVTVITTGSVTTIADPYGFDSGDAGNGALIDGSVADPSGTLPPTCLFYSTTFIVPNADGISVTNKARVEWLNSFTYYANRGIRLFLGQTGYAGQGVTRVGVSDVIGTVSIGDTFTYYANDGYTIISSGEVVAINGDIFSLQGNVNDIELITEVTQPPYFAQGSACLKTTNFKFGTSSLYLDGTGDYVNTYHTFKLALNELDFCVECWFYPLAFPTTESSILSKWGVISAEQTFKVSINNLGQLILNINDGTTVITENSGIEFLLDENGQLILDEDGNPIVSETYAVILATWQHLALTRNDDEISVYLNGLKKISIPITSGSYINESSSDFIIGHTLGDTEYFTGYVDEVRVSRYTSRYVSNFAPPTIAFVADYNTSILLHFDGSNNSTSIVDDAFPSQDIVFTNARGTAIISVDYSDFAAEMRSINSANVYGNYGAVAEGRNVLGYLIGHNFGYIGCGKDSSNDQKLCIQENEIVTTGYAVLYYDSNDHKGDIRIGDIFYVSQETGDVIFDAKSINFGINGNISLIGDNSSTYIDKLVVETGNLRIHDNNIDSLFGPVNFRSSTGSTYLNTNVVVTGNTAITNDVKVSGNIYLGDTPFDTVAVYPHLTQDINPNQTDYWNLGSTSKRWNTLFGTLLDVDGTIQITDNIISTIDNDVDLQLIANGTGKIHVLTTDVQVDQLLTVTGDFVVNGVSNILALDITGNVIIIGNINQTGDSYIEGTFTNYNIIINGDSYIDVLSTRLYNNTVVGQAIDTDLEFYGNGSGGVILDSKLKVTNNIISNVWSSATTDIQKSILFSPNGSGNLVINSNKSLILPIGNSTTRALSQVGEVRYNNLSNMIEGWSPTGYVNFMNLWDSDRNTFITAELTPNANDQTLRFGINGTVKATIDDTKLTTNVIHVDNIEISSNNIKNLVSANDVEFLLDGTGVLNVNDVHLNDDEITNTKNTSLTLSNTGAGYVKFSGTYGVVIPYGDNSGRRLLPEVGETRYNTELEYLEVFNGTVWQAAQGYSPLATNDEVEEIMGIWSLILG